MEDIISEGSPDKEIYNLLHDRSGLLTIYYVENLNQTEKFVPLNDISSIYVSDKYICSPTLLAHTPGKDKVTVVYNSFT
jgi:hypothetical protein